jgi:hypothetical protein
MHPLEAIAITLAVGLVVWGFVEFIDWASGILMDAISFMSQYE